MKKKIIALIAVVFAFFGITVSLTTVNAAESTADLTNVYYYDLTGDISGLKRTTGISSVYLNDKNSTESHPTLTISSDSSDNGELSKAINATGKSINPESSVTSFTSALKLNSVRTLNLYTSAACSITLNYVVAADGDTEIKVNGAEIALNGAKSATTNTITFDGNAGNNTLVKTDGKEIELIEVLVCVNKSATIDANAYIQTGYAKVDSSTTKYFKRFVTIVNGVSSIYDLYNVEYVLTYTYTDNGAEKTATATVKPHVVDVIYAENNTAYKATINDKEYTFSNKETTKYLVYTVASAKSTTTDGTTTWEYDYSGKVKVEVKLNGNTLATKELEFSLEHSA